MPTKGYILIETSVGHTDRVARSLESIRGVLAADTVTGPYDIIAVVESDDITTLSTLIADGIHRIEGITRTITCLSIT